MVKVLVHCNIVNNDYQQDSKVLYTFVPNKQFGSILETSPTNSFKKRHVIQSFHVLKYGYRLKYPTTRNRRQNKLNFSH